MKKLQIKRGIKSVIPILEQGELALAIDTNDFFIGTENGNELLNDSQFGV